jgi:hypothetical protein
LLLVGSFLFEYMIHWYFIFRFTFLVFTSQIFGFFSNFMHNFHAYLGLCSTKKHISRLPKGRLPFLYENLRIRQTRIHRKINHHETKKHANPASSSLTAS